MNPAKLIEARKNKNWSQKDLEIKSGISRSTISHYEGGTVKPQARTVFKLTQALGISPAYLNGELEELPNFGESMDSRPLNTDTDQTIDEFKSLQNHINSTSLSRRDKFLLIQHLQLIFMRKVSQDIEDFLRE